MCTIVLFKSHSTLFGHVKTIFGQSKRSFRGHGQNGKEMAKIYIFWIKTIILLLYHLSILCYVLKEK